MRPAADSAPVSRLLAFCADRAMQKGWSADWRLGDPRPAPRTGQGVTNLPGPRLALVTLEPRLRSTVVFAISTPVRAKLRSMLVDGFLELVYTGSAFGPFTGG